MAIFSMLFGAALAASTPHPIIQQAYAPARTRYPALWVANDDDTIIYLFGTFHALDGETRWFEQAVLTAFLQSDELMLETVVPKPPALPSVNRFTSFAPGPLPIGVMPAPVAQLAPSASYLATTKIVMNAGRTKGLSTDLGADAVLRDVADQTGKRVGGLESFESQINMFGDLPAGSKAPPPQDAKTVQALGAMLTQLQAGWNSGAVEETFTPLLKRMQAQSPQTYRTMFIERNARWATWIADRMKSPGTVFVAVGAGHLSGPDSVQKQLATLGVKSERVN